MNIRFLNRFQGDILVGILMPLCDISKPRSFFFVFQKGILDGLKNFQYPGDLELDFIVEILKLLSKTSMPKSISFDSNKNFQGYQKNYQYPYDSD
jgi:hypothetical protein